MDGAPPPTGMATPRTSTPSCAGCRSWVWACSSASTPRRRSPCATSSDVRALGLMVTAKTGRRAPAVPRAAPVVRVSDADAATCGRTLGIRHRRRRPRRRSGGALRWTPAVQTPGAASVTMLPRADGWCAARSSADTPFAVEAIKPATVAGRHLLLARLHGDPPQRRRCERRKDLRPPTASPRRGRTAPAATARPTSCPAPTPASYPAWASSRSTTGCWCGIPSPGAWTQGRCSGRPPPRLHLRIHGLRRGAGRRRRPHPRRQHAHPPRHHLPKSWPVGRSTPRRLGAGDLVSAPTERARHDRQASVSQTGDKRPART